MFTGIKPIDDAGGIPDATNVLLLAHSGAEKVIFSIRTIEDALIHDRKGLFITTDNDPREIETRLAIKAAGTDLAKFTGKSLWFVDCYTWTLGADHREPTNVTDIIIPGPSALNDLSIGIAQSLQNAMDKPTAVFLSLSTLLLYNNPEVVFRFLQITGARLKSSNATTLFIADVGMHDDKTIETLRHLTDITIELKSMDGKQMLFSPSLGIMNWTSYEL